MQRPGAPTDIPAQSEKAKQEVEKRGVGQRSRAKIKLRDGSEVKGYISKISDTSFEITDKAGNPVNIRYSDVAKVKNPGLSRTAKIAIGAGVGCCRRAHRVCCSSSASREQSVTS